MTALKAPSDLAVLLASGAIQMNGKGDIVSTGPNLILQADWWKEESDSGAPDLYLGLYTRGSLQEDRKDLHLSGIFSAGLSAGLGIHNDLNELSGPASVGVGFLTGYNRTIGALRDALPKDRMETGIRLFCNGIPLLGVEGSVTAAFNPLNFREPAIVQYLLGLRAILF